MRAIAVITALVISTTLAHAGLIEVCCQHAAAEKAHTGQAAACYASVCQQYVSMNPDGRSCGARGKTFTAYRAALQATCGVSR